MVLSNVAVAEEPNRARSLPTPAPAERAPSASGVSWAAVLAGAVAAAALSLILLVLGAGLGLSSVSAWSQSGVTAKTFGVSTIVWITVTQLLASGMGGFLAGRLRVKWVAVHTDEVYFRDTAHGFLAWAVASLATAAMFTSVLASVVGSGVQAGASVAAGAVGAASGETARAAVKPAVERIGNASAPMDYLFDSLFRKDTTAQPLPSPPRDEAVDTSNATGGASASGAPAEITRIFMNSIGGGALPADDLRYVGQMVAQRTGISQAEAEKRVNYVYARAQTQLRDAQAKAKEATDAARKASAYAALWFFVSLLIGAFSASVAATWGGQLRDA